MFRTVSEKFLKWLSKLHSTCPEEPFEEEKNVVKKYNFCIYFRTLSENISDF